ncbi:hypothetical protein [Streptomyces sp. NPDC059008]|uniref:hypothetical protein n=1 Tax=Streptomyces sp. NPDC059008 TaxID=3346693 RepID=UPI0036BB1EC9
MSSSPLGDQEGGRPRKWRGRFAAGGLAALAEVKRSGRPRIYGPQGRIAVVAAATGGQAAPPLEPAPSLDKVAAHCHRISDSGH